MNSQLSCLLRGGEDSTLFCMVTDSYGDYNYKVNILHCSLNKYSYWNH